MARYCNFRNQHDQKGMLPFLDDSHSYLQEMDGASFRKTSASGKVAPAKKDTPEALRVIIKAADASTETSLLLSRYLSLTHTHSLSLSVCLPLLPFHACCR